MYSIFLFYSICAVVTVFITGVRIKEIQYAFSFPRFRLKKVIFFALYIQNWEEIESLKNEKSPGKVLEFCFPISKRTLNYPYSDFEDKDDKDESAVQKDSEVTDEKETSKESGEKETSKESGEENKEKSDGETTKDADTSKDVPSAPMAVARDLAKALVQIEKGIEHRFLVPPFGKSTVEPVLSGHKW